MEKTEAETFLRQVLFGDAIVTGVMVAALFLLEARLAEWLALPRPLLLGAALSLVPFVAYVAAVAWQARLRPTLVWGVIAANALWVAGSAAVAFSSEIAPNALGYAFIAAQALAVAVIAELELVSLRRSYR